MVREKVKAKKAKLIPDQSFNLENDNKGDQDIEMIELYEETNETASENTQSENMDVLETFLEVEDISDAAAGLEEYSQRYDQEDEMVQCVPELVVSAPVASETKSNHSKQRPRMKNTPKRRSPEKTPRLNKPTKKFMSIAPQRADVESDYEDYEFPKAKKEGLWVQCSKSNCLKWRKLPNDIEPSTVPHRWVCSMNTDSSKTECSASQETCDSQIDFDVVYTSFVAGSLVWAKVPGYPWWPGMVEDDPDYKCCYETDNSDVNPISYHVSFIFDKDVSRSWVSYLCIQKFEGTENPNETGSKQKKYAKALSRALVRARDAIDLSLAQRIKKYSFNVLYKGQIGSHTDDKNRKPKKSKRVKINPEPSNHKKSNTNKPDKKSKRPSLTESEKGSKSLESVVKKKVNKKKRVLRSSDEDGSGKETTIIDGDKPRKTNKRKQVKISPEPSNPNKSNSIKPDKKSKRPSLAESEKSSESPESVVNKKVNKKKRVLPSSDEDDSGEETTTSDDRAVNTDTGATPVEAQNAENQLNSDESVKSRQQVPPENGKTHTREKKGPKNHVRNKNKPVKTNKQASKKKRKSTTSDEEEKATQSPKNSTSSCQLKAKKKTVNKSDEKITIKTDMKKSKFINPLKVRKSKSALNANNTREDSVDQSPTGESTSEELGRDTNSDNVMYGVNNDTTMQSSMDGITNDINYTAKREDIYISDEPNATLDMSLGQTDFKKSVKKPSSLIKKQTKVAKDTSSEPKVSVVKPKKFELSLAVGKKSKPVNGKKVKKIKTTTSPKTLWKQSRGDSQKELGVEGTSVKPKYDETTKKTSKVKKAKQSFCKFKAPVKASFKVSPAATVTSSKANKDEKSTKETKKTLEEVLGISSSDDPRTHPENYVNIDSLERDISNLYQELSDKAAASTGVMSEDDVENVTEASDCVTMEFLDQQISGNTRNSERINARQLTDSPEF